MIFNRYSFLLLIAFCISVFAKSQSDSTWEATPMVSFSGFVDVFYAFDFNKPTTNYRQDFLYNHNRHNETNLNLGLVEARVEHAKYRATIALQAGTYANDNYAAENNTLKNVFEANAGVALNEKNTIWLDAGIFPSHLGFESAKSIENVTLSRSLSAENSPYFLTGSKLTYTPNQTWMFVAVVSNGWQRIQRVQGNSMLGYGTQVMFKPSNKTTLNWSTFVGTDDPDVIRRVRYFNNFYGLFDLTSKIDLTVGFDYGLQQSAIGSREYDSWFCPTIISSYRFSENWKTAVRLELFNDKQGVIIAQRNGDDFQTGGMSLNLDYAPVKNVTFRVEGRWFKGINSIFIRENSFVNDDFTLLASLAMKFGT